MSQGRRIIGNSVILLIGQAGERLVYLAVIILLARYLGVDNYGQYTFAFAFAGLFGAFFEFGFNVVLIRDASRVPGEVGSYLRQVMSLQLLTTLLGLVILTAASLIFNYDKLIITAVILIGLVSFFNAMADPLRAMFFSQNRIVYEAVVLVCSQIALLAGILVSFKLHLGLIGVIIAGPVMASIINLSLSTILNINNIRDAIREKTDIKKWAYWLKEAYPFALLTLFVFIYFRIGSVMLFKMRSAEVVGLYNAAYNLVFGIMFVSTAVALTVFPVLSKSIANDLQYAKKVYNSAFKAVLMTAVPIALGTSLLSGEMISLVYGTSFAGAAIILKLIIWVIVFMFITNLFSRVLTALGRQQLVAIISGLSVVINIVLNLCLIPSMGAMGSAMAVIISEMFIFGFQIYYIFRLFFKVNLLNMLLKIIPSAAVMGLLVFATNGMNIFLRVLAAAVLYFIMLFITRFFNADEINLLKRFAP